MVSLSTGQTAVWHRTWQLERGREREKTEKTNRFGNLWDNIKTLMCIIGILNGKEENRVKKILNSGQKYHLIFQIQQKTHLYIHSYSNC